MRCQNSEVDTGQNHTEHSYHAFLNAIRTDVSLANRSCGLHLELPCVHLNQVALLGQDVVLEFVQAQIRAIFEV